MKSRRILLGIVMALVLALPRLAFAQSASSGAGGRPTMKKKAETKKKAEKTFGQIHGYLEPVVRAAAGFHNARFQEYRDLTPGLSGGFGLHYEDADGLHVAAHAARLGKDDIETAATVGDYGAYSVRVGYRQIPHNYAFGALTLYSGAGTGNLTIDPTVQATLANTLLTTPPIPKSGPLIPAHGKNTGALLKQDPFAITTGQMGTLLGLDGHLIDVANRRDRIGVDVDVPLLSPLDVGGYMHVEHWTGTRPGSAFFGSDDDLGLIAELPSPTNFNVNNHGFHATYGKRPWYLDFSYDGSTFSNETGNLLVANPMVAMDSPAGPLGILRSLPDVALSGTSTALLPLAPSNSYGNLSFTGAALDLPLRGKLTVNGQLGWFRNSTNFAPYTANSALLAPANIPDFSGVPGFLASPGAFDGKADSSFFLARYTMSPWDWLHVNAHYRTYDYANHTPGYVLGKVVGDSAWETDDTGAGVARQTYYESFKTSSTGLDLGFDVARGTSFNFTWQNLTTDRTNRAVSHQNEGSYRLGLDSSPLSWLNFRASYERADRTGSYDINTDTILGRVFDASTGQFVFENPDHSIFPYIIPYDLASRQRDRVRMDLSVNPLDWLTLTGSLDSKRDRFPDSPFGLQWQNDSGWAVGADVTPSKRFSLSFDYETNYYNTFQQNRHWKPSFDNWNLVTTAGDPYSTEPSYGSPSNWTAQDREKEKFLSVAARYEVVPDFLNLGARYTLSENDGSVAFASPLGTMGANGNKNFIPGADQNFYLPFPIGNLDNNRLHSLNAHADVRLQRNLSLTLGWLWEKFYTDDINNGFRNVNYISPAQAATVTSSLLLGLFPRSYDANVYYLTLKYKL